MHKGLLLAGREAAPPEIREVRAGDLTLPGEQEDLDIAADARALVNGVARVDVRDE